MSDEVEQAVEEWIQKDEIADLELDIRDLFENEVLAVEVINEMGTSKFFFKAKTEVQEGKVYITVDFRDIGETTSGRTPRVEELLAEDRD